jgi:hypothetical protein
LYSASFRSRSGVATAALASPATISVKAGESAAPSTTPSRNRSESVARARELLTVAPPPKPEPAKAPADQPRVLPTPCPCCGGRMRVIEVFTAGTQPKLPPTPMRAIIRISSVDHRRWSCAGNHRSWLNAPDRHAKRPSDPLPMPLRRRPGCSSIGDTAQTIMRGARVSALNPGVRPKSP